MGLSIERGSLTSGQNIKPRLQRQYLVFFNIFFLKLEITLPPLL